MARKTTNYEFNISEGTDLVNPLTDIFPNFEDIDTDLKGVSDSAVGTATELLTGTVHALVRSDSDRNVFTFTATSNFEAGETFTLDGVQVTALTPDGQTLSTGCYIIGSEVLVAVKGTLMTVYVNPSKALDSDKLDGHDSTYYATASDVSDLSDDVSALSNKVGTGTLIVGNDCVDGINTLNTHLSGITNKFANDTDSIPSISSAPHVENAKCRAGIVSISGYTDAGGGYTIGNVPEPYRPHQNQKVCAAYEIASAIDVGKVAGITIDNNGNLNLETLSNLTYGVYYTFTYIV